MRLGTPHSFCLEVIGTELFNGGPWGRTLALSPFRFAAVFLAAGLAASPPCAADAPPGRAPSAAQQARRNAVPRVTLPPKIEDFAERMNGDGDSSAPPPFGMARIENFLQREPHDGQPASLATSAFLGYDDKNLYLVFLCWDDPAELRAHLAKREDFGNDDHVALYLDTFHDQRRAYLFAANAHGVQLDGIHTDGQGLDLSFDTVWRSEGRITPRGFIVFFAIPFRSLRFSSHDVQTWGLLLQRSIPRKNEISSWPFISRGEAGFVSQFGALSGLERISPGRNLQFIPYGILTASRFLDPAASGGPDFRNKTEFRGGLDGKAVLRDAVTVDYALNPDFSQVESDEPQVTINQRFEVFFPEKRPFFIENAGYFRTPINLFFSRRVADPQFGLRFTGKARGWSFGGMGIDDREPSAASAPPGSRPGPFTDCDPGDESRAAVGVARAQREFAEQSAVGFFFSSRDAPTCANHTFSMDTRLKLSRQWVLTAQWVGAFTRRFDRSNIRGFAGWTDIAHYGRHLTSVFRYEDRSPDFRSHLGFVPRVDIRQVTFYNQYLWRPKRSRLLAHGPTLYSLVNWNRRSRVQDWFVFYEWYLEFPRQTSLQFGGQEQFELFRGFEFREHRHHARFGTAPLRWLVLSASVGWRSAPNFFPAAPLQPFLGTATDVSVGASFRPAPRLRFDQTYLYSRLGTREGSTPPGFAPGTAIFNNHILRSKVNYQFTRALSLRAILDYNATLPNQQLTLFPRSKVLTGDVLFTYLVHPGTALYVGYTDGAMNQELVTSGMPPVRSLQTTRGLASSSGRQFFVKLSYLFRY
jgi:hypothetical protein